MFLEKNCEESYPRETQLTIRLEQLDGGIITIIITNGNIEQKREKFYKSRKEYLYKLQITTTYGILVELDLWKIKLKVIYVINFLKVSYLLIH